MTTLYYESHVTIEPVFDDDLEIVRGLAARHGFRVADLLMQKRRGDSPERSRYDTFCTGRSRDMIDLRDRMFALVDELESGGRAVWRYKIEDVIIDSKIDDSGRPLK